MRWRSADWLDQVGVHARSQASFLIPLHSVCRKRRGAAPNGLEADQVDAFRGRCTPSQPRGLAWSRYTGRMFSIALTGACEWNASWSRSDPNSAAGRGPRPALGSGAGPSVARGAFARCGWVFLPRDWACGLSGGGDGRGLGRRRIDFRRIGHRLENGKLGLKRDVQLTGCDWPAICSLRWGLGTSRLRRFPK